MRVRRAERESAGVTFRQPRFPRKRTDAALFLKVIAKHVRMTAG
jgi:hypothetical protein